MVDADQTNEAEQTNDNRVQYTTIDVDFPENTYHLIDRDELADRLRTHIGYVTLNKEHYEAMYNEERLRAVIHPLALSEYWCLRHSALKRLENMQEILSEVRHSSNEELRLSLFYLKEIYGLEL